MDKKTIESKTITINDMQYQNKIIASQFDIDSQKQNKKELKNTILTILQNNLQNNDFTKDSKTIQLTTLYITDSDFLSIKNNIKKLLASNTNNISYKDIRIAILSSYKNKLVASDDRYVKVEGTSVSVADFLKSIQASLVKKVESSKRKDYLLDQKKKQQAKIDKELARQQKKTNKRVEKQQKASGTLKTKITD